MIEQPINKLNYYEYICGDEKYYIAAYIQQQADLFFMFKVMSLGNVDEKDTMCYVMSDERAKLLEISATEPGFIKAVK